MKPLHDRTLRRPGPVPASLTARGLLRQALDQHRGIYVLGAVGVIGTNAVEVGIPKCVQWVLEVLLGHPFPFYLPHGWDPLAILVGFLVLLMVLQAMLRYLWRTTLGQESHHSSATLKAALWRSASKLPREALLERFGSGTMMSIATSDVGSARNLFGWTLVGLLDLCFLGLMTVSAMLWIDPLLTACALCTLLGLPPLTKRLADQEYDRHFEAQESLAELNERCHRAVTTQRLQRVSKTSSVLTSRLSDMAEVYRRKRLSVLTTMLHFVLVLGLSPLLAYSVLFTFGLWRAQQGLLSIGGFVAMQSYILLLQGPLGELGYLVADWQQGLASLRRILEVLHHPGDRVFEAPLVPVSRTTVGQGPTVFEVEALRFSYPGGVGEILSGCSFRLDEGEWLALRGPVGRGKSTPLWLLAGLERRYRGSIYYRGQDLATLSTSVLRADLALVPQRAFLFAASVAANLLLDRRASEAELWEVLRIVQLAEDFQSLPHGLDTPLGEQGINLSGGQRQRLCLARALVGKPKVVLLDDPLGSVDLLTERLIITSLQSRFPDTTVLWAAHRGSVLRYCSRVMEL